MGCPVLKLIHKEKNGSRQPLSDRWRHDLVPKARRDKESIAFHERNGLDVFVPYYRHTAEICPENAVDPSRRLGLYYLLPATILFLIFRAIHPNAHISAFITGTTPYPRRCWGFCMPVGQGLTMLLKRIRRLRSGTL